MAEIRNVLSLFDGISCGKYCLDKAGIKYKKYYASEIDENSIKISDKNHKDIIRLGDITKINFKKLKSIDLIIGGSPCQDLSKAKNNALGLKGEKSKLFYEFVRAIREIKPKYFMLENVKVSKEALDIINKELGTHGVLIDSGFFGPQRRVRYYWTNFPIAPIDKPSNKVIRDIEDKKIKTKTETDERILKRNKTSKSGIIYYDPNLTGFYSIQYIISNRNKKGKTVIANLANNYKVTVNNNITKYRKLSVNEVERMQGLPTGYTNVRYLANCHKYMGLGNGWECNTVTHIFKSLKKYINHVKISNSGDFL